MRHYTLYNIGKLLALTCVLLLGGTEVVMGQGQYTIIPQAGKTFPQENIPTLVDTVYIENKKDRSLQVGNYQYYWYFRWYRKNADGTTTVQNLKTNNTSGWNGQIYLYQSNVNSSYFWHHGMNNGNQKGASMINYISDGSIDSVFCDLSFNVDGLGINPSGDTFTEPTIGKRYKFYIKNADEMRTRLNGLGNNTALDTFYITVPMGATGVNLQMNMSPENYFWGTNYQGNSFQATVTGENISAISSGKLIRLSGSITKEITVEVRAKTNGYPSNESPCLAQYILTPQENSGFQTESQIADNEERNPAKHDDKYAEVGAIDFDYDEAIFRSSLSADNNMRTMPIDPSTTTYSFANPILDWISNPIYMPEDAYGLYRSANVQDISERRSYSREWGSSYEKSYGHFQRSNKGYGWYYTNIHAIADRELYDRTYYNTGSQQCGYFYYVNASQEAGRVVTIPIDGTICANTELTIVAWVADITDASTLPNVSLILRGENEVNGTSGVIHRFSSGEMTLANENDRAIWKQICYRITVSKEMLASYTKFVVELNNNTPDSQGGDYAIDDIRIYKTLPDISVRRESACDYSTLIVSSDYNTLMRNMGWSKNPNVLANVDLTNPDVRKYRYGLMGKDPYTSDPHEHVGNMYYSITETNLDGPIDYDPGSSTPVPGQSLNDWVTLNKSLLKKGEELQSEVLKSLSKSMRVAVPTDLNLSGEGVEEHGEVPSTEEKAAEYEITLNLRALNDFLSDTEPKQIYDDEGNPLGDPITIWEEDDLKNAEISTDELIKYLEEVATITKTDDNKKTGSIEIKDDVIKKIAQIGSEENKAYEEWLIKVYDFLELPRIHCPWQKETISGDKILCLGAIDVNNTDLKYKGEKGPDEEVGATGKYHVVVFNAEHVYGNYGRPEQSGVSFLDDCLLHSSFIVQPSSNFAINTDMTHNGKGCLGSITSIKGNLLVDEVDEVGNIISEEPIPFEEAYGDKETYTFDWFIGTIEEYNQYTNEITTTEFFDLRGVIKGFRDTQSDKTAYFTKEMIKNSSFYITNQKDADLLISLLGDATTKPKLIIGNGKNESDILWPEHLVAMPYVPDIAETQPSEPSINGKTYQFCVEPQELTLETNASPALSVGFSDMNYQGITVVPLRLGLRNINDGSGNGVLLSNIPIQNNIKFGSNGQSLGMPYGIDASTTIYLDDNDSELKKVATVTDLKATSSDGGTLSIQFNDRVAQYFKEGMDEYRLYIPFGEYADDNASQKIEGSCGGYAMLVLKIIPEYLTWTGDADAVWYNDGNWKQSTGKELYMGDKNDTDANGSDPITNAFAPLYFTKITINPDKGMNVLALKNESELRQADQYNTLDLSAMPGLVTENIQYDMAVNNTGTNNAIEIVPYYGNKVSQIYFKPNAKLVNQHYLDYEKAWVEFEMSNGAKRWFASPLQDVYAGDFYAPTTTGRQETEAFTEIKYDANNTNSRWAPAFYQKAWNKAIAYATSADGTSKEQVAAVKSNWSIEYNDMTVSYPIGKGFYLSVEEVPNGGAALVRLPKADAVANYKYETKASVLRADDDPKANSGQLAAYKNTDGSLSNGTVTVKLDDLFGESEDDVAGEGSTLTKRHFLVGNPYMTYLNMNEFFNENRFLAKKYWRLENGTASAVVGTPDVPFGEDGATTGTVEPMEAFFVELADNATVNDNTITFTPSMMSATKIAEGGATTKGATATNPVITITAERGEIKSVATLSTSDRADNGYKADEDAVVLLDSELNAPMVYTIAGSLAAQVNAVKSIDNIGLGLYNDSREEVTITINGLSRSANPLYLYDAHTGKSVKMEGDSHGMTIGGDSHGRYYLRDSEPGSELDNAISIQSTRRGRVIVSAIRPVKEIKAFSLSGSQVRGFSVNSAQYGFDLPAGIYMIYASDGERERTEKVIVR